MMRRSYEYNSYYYHPPRQQEDYYIPTTTTTPRYPDLPKFYLLNKFMISKEAAPAPAPAPARSDQTPPQAQPLQDHHNTSNKKKVQFMPEKKVVEVVDDVNNMVERPIRKDSTIDEAADGYIQQKHKKFELAKWMTFNSTTTTNSKDTTTT